MPSVQKRDARAARPSAIPPTKPTARMTVGSPSVSSIGPPDARLEALGVALGRPVYVQNNS
jgi:hypothetical protein